MGAFPGPNGNVILVRNHEVNNPGTPFGDPANAYDPMGQAGTTTIEVTPRGGGRQQLHEPERLVMSCAGGHMPWDSWMACEETVNGPDVGPDFTGVSNVPLQQPHGFIFDVPIDGVSDAQPITQAGRFAHEAAVLDPKHGILYETEDDFQIPSGFFRYIPATDPVAAGRLDNNGRLQMLAVKAPAERQPRRTPTATCATLRRRVGRYLTTRPRRSRTRPDNPLQPPTSRAIAYVAAQGFVQGAAKFSRLEGAVYDGGMVYFTSTQGGGPAEETDNEPAGWGNGSGQVWAYDTNGDRVAAPLRVARSLDPRPPGQHHDEPPWNARHL